MVFLALCGILTLCDRFFRIFSPRHQARELAMQRSRTSENRRLRFSERDQIKTTIHWLRLNKMVILRGNVTKRSKLCCSLNVEPTLQHVESTLKKRLKILSWCCNNVDKITVKGVFGWTKFLKRRQNYVDITLFRRFQPNSNLLTMFCDRWDRSTDIRSGISWLLHFVTGIERLKSF